MAVSIATFLVQRSGGAVHLDNIPLSLRIGNALISYVVYLVKFLWPSNLAVFYTYVPIPAWRAGGRSSCRNYGFRPIDAPRHAAPSYLAVGWFWYLGTLAPVIGLIQVGVQARADRYTYIPMIGIAMMLAWGVRDLAVAGPESGRRSRLWRLRHALPAQV